MAEEKVNWVKNAIRETVGLDEYEKHNALVEINETQWEASTPKKLYSVVVLVIIMFGSIANNLELNMINTAFSYPIQDKYHYIGTIFGTDLN